MQEAKRGDRVSLIVTKRIFFFQTPGGINLNAENNVSQVIPDSATDEHIKQINVAISNGHLSLGEPQVKVEVPERDSDVKEMLELGRNKIYAWIDKLLADKTVKSSTKSSILEKIIDLEKAEKNRKSVISYAENKLKYIGGISSVTETDKEIVEIQLTT